MIEQIRQKIKRGEYIITRHAQKRCDARKISLDEIKHVIYTGEIIENYPYDKPYPSFLILGNVRENMPLYVLCAMGQIVHIITVHWLDPFKWLDPKTRREKKP
ncbi:MAG: hypothetical protein A2W74_02045 [Planctomycetes bacterium RIFCSPLOWO2_12_38_17]|nr:MAG: hypothetical protein A2W74_02045 [Planctomycetes bacterium RIFCSPLOWO2_12_38_17]